MEPIPVSLLRDISPPRVSKIKKCSRRAPAREPSKCHTPMQEEPTLAEVEAGKAKVENHLQYFRDHLSQACRNTGPSIPRISIDSFAQLYESNQHEHGNHFVIHQHNHPRAGVHYDLRLQFSETSSLSFAVPKGLPGNANSQSQGRMAVETRVHNMWNSLIESASEKTGSLLIWDTGTYSVLPRKIVKDNLPSPQTTDNETDHEETTDRALSDVNLAPENEKLKVAFSQRYIRLRLHGSRLPENYTVLLRLPLGNDFGTSLPQTMRRLKRRRKPNSSDAVQISTSPPPRSDDNRRVAETHEDINTDDEDTTIRVNNAYPGATNSIGSIHQRKWFMTLDRRSSGFMLGSEGIWKRDGEKGFEAFHVQGRDVERSIVTGRLASEVEADDGVEGFVGRKGWVGISR